MSLGRRAATAGVLCVTFLIVYGVCMRIAAASANVGTWYYAWERHIPFVPLFIVPYMSIDLFFVAAPFLCRDRRELSTLTWRITFGIAVAGLFFLFMPLRFAFDRPPVAGVLGFVFDRFRELDQPFNLFPSLHIVLRTLLATHYYRYTRGRLRRLTTIWFSLIGASTLLVYQHHVVDVLGGFALAALCFYVFPDGRSGSREMTPNRRIGWYYSGVAAACLTMALAGGGGWLWFLWPAVSCGIVGGAYFGLGPAVYRKREGRLSLSTRLWLAPVLLGQWLSLKHYARRSNAYDQLTDRVWVGRALGPADAAKARAAGVRAVLDLTCEFAAPAAFRKERYLNLPVLDLTAPTPLHLHRAVRFIACHATQGVVYIHCKAGYSRTAAVAGAYLLHSGAARNADEAVALLKAARPGIVIRPEVEKAIRDFAPLSPGTPKDDASNVGRF